MANIMQLMLLILKTCLDENKRIAKLGGHAAKSAREDLEKNLGKSVITPNNNLNYQYRGKKEISD